MKAKYFYFGACCAFYLCAVGLWCASLYVDFSINLTNSLPGTFYVIHPGSRFVKGDLVAYRWKGGATYPAGTTFIKQVTGFPSDIVKRVGNAFWVNDHYIGVAKPVSKAGIPLIPVNPSVIPDGTYFMSTPHPDSLDSRYAISGNVLQSEIIGKAYAVF